VVSATASRQSCRHSAPHPVAKTANTQHRRIQPRIISSGKTTGKSSQGRPAGTSRDAVRRRSTKTLQALSGGSALKGGNIQFHHPRHRLEYPPRDGRIRIGQKTGQTLGHDLPRHAPPVA
jgi:hypothetical protein